MANPRVTGISNKISYAKAETESLRRVAELVDAGREGYKGHGRAEEIFSLTKERIIIITSAGVFYFPYGGE